MYQIRYPYVALDHWVNTFVSIYDKHAHFQKKRVKQSTKPPWLTKEIESEIHYRNHLLKCKQLVEYRQQINKVTSMLRSSKKKYFQQLVTSSQNSPLIGKATNKLTKKSDSTNKDTSANQITFVI